MIEDQIPTIKFYSQKSVATATFWGGPLAAGILLRRNFITLGKEKHGLYSVIIGILSTVFIFIGVFSIPENIIDKIPSPVIPAIYTAIIFALMEKLMGKELSEYKEKNGEFYSGWKSAGIGGICLVILLGGIFGYIFLSTSDFDTQQYDNSIAVFNDTESKALEIYSTIETNDAESSIDFIDKKGIPYWESNLQILSELDKMEGIYDDLLKQDNILRNYCNLRIEQLKILKKALSENTDAYDTDMEKISENINAEIAKLKK